MNVSALQDFSLARIRLFGRSTMHLVLSCALLFPGLVQADIVYGTVTGVTADNLTLVVYKENVMVASAAIMPTGNNQYEYRLNLTPGTYNIIYKDMSRPIINYPGTNRVNISYAK